jgi:hypothetical protein
MKLAMWRSRFACEVAAREAAAIIGRCKHEKDCPGATIETEPCFANCVDREQRMSALVVLNAARMFAPVIAPRPNQPYFAPSREYFSEVLAELGAAQVERDALREMLRSMGAEVPTPPQNTEPALLLESPAQFTMENLEEEEESPTDTEEEKEEGTVLEQ